MVDPLICQLFFQQKWFFFISIQYYSFKELKIKRNWRTEDILFSFLVRLFLRVPLSQIKISRPFFRGSHFSHKKLFTCSVSSCWCWSYFFFFFHWKLWQKKFWKSTNIKAKWENRRREKRIYSWMRWYWFFKKENDGFLWILVLVWGPAMKLLEEDLDLNR